MLEVCLPGTGGMMPLPNRWLTCCWIEYQGAAILIDCGEGSQIAIRKAGLKPSRIELLLLTHYHADHVSGLPGILLTLANIPRTEPLTIAGPPGLKRVVSALTVIAPRLPFHLNLAEITAPEEWETVLANTGGHDRDNPPVKITALSLRHGTPCLGYRVDLSRKPVFNPEKAKALNIPVRLYKELHAGNAVTLESGEIIQPEQVLDGARKPSSVCYFTDTKPFPAMAEFARGCSLLISEGMYYSEEMRTKIDEKNHMLFGDSARLAAKCGAERLWLTHYSPAMERPQDGLRDVRKIFAETTAARDGEKTVVDK